jgi:hypothetical protein
MSLERVIGTKAQSAVGNHELASIAQLNEKWLWVTTFGKKKTPLVLSDTQRRIVHWLSV